MAFCQNQSEFKINLVSNMIKKNKANLGKNLY